MMKKLISMAMAMVLLITAAQALAASTDVYAPSYTMLTGTYPITEDFNSDGRWLVYENVSQTEYDQFVSYFEGQGFSVYDSQTQDSMVYSLASYGATEFLVAYNWNSLRLVVMYPKGVMEESKAYSSGSSSSGSSSSGSSSSSYGSAIKDCPSCLGLGECSHCFGDGDFNCSDCIGGRCIACDDGKILVTFDSKGNPRYRDCSKCTAGRCSKCHGDGRVDCSYCRGGKCSTCNGRGTVIY